ncbi:hypothetical protein AAHC03_026171 [Spirometra sp. Aus1]
MEESYADDCISTFFNRLNCTGRRSGRQPFSSRFWAFLCCRSEHSDTNYVSLPRPQQPSLEGDRYRKVSPALPSSVVPLNTTDKRLSGGKPLPVTGQRYEAPRSTTGDTQKPAVPQTQPTPTGQNPPRQPPQCVSDLRKRYEDNGVTPSPYYHQPSPRQPSSPTKFRDIIGRAISSSEHNGAHMDGAKFFAGSINVDEDDEMLEVRRPKGNQLQEVVTQLQREVEKHEKRHHYKSIFENAQLYQIYDIKFQRKESRRLRHRFRESIRKRLAARKAQAAAGRLALEDSPNDFRVLRDMEDSDESSDEENQEGRGLGSPHTSFGKGDAYPPSPSIRVRPRESRDRDRVAPTAKYGEMRNVAKKFAGSGPSRAHWADMHEVTERGLAAGLSSYERNLQEARFEILTSEASYFKSLTVLVDFFYKAPVFTPGSPNAIVTPFDKHQLFSNILDIHVTSENLLHSLETHYKENPMMDRICDILYEHSENKLSCYISYVKNQMYQFDTLNEIMKKPASAEEIKKIQSMPACNGLDLNSFLVLPMQRVMRLRLLVVAVLHYTPRSSPAYISGLVALASIETLVETCNREKGHMEQKQRLLTLAKQLEFKGSIAAVGTGSRQLLKEGNLRLTAAPSNQSGAFRRKFSDVVKNRPTVVTLFLFTDVLLISRRKGDKYLVEEVCPRDKIRVTVEYTPASAVIKVSEYTMKKPANADDFFVQPKLLPSREVRNSRMHESSNPPSRSSSLRHLRSSSGSRSPLRNSSGIYDDTATPIFPFILTCQTEEGIVDYHFMADSLNQRERWLDALKENYYSVPNGVTYDTWDCPQVLAITGHGPTEPDELDVKEGDLMNVIVDLSDGWFKGALPDNRMGWVPKSACAEVDDPQARRQTMKNYLLSDEARKAYLQRKAQEKRSTFARVNEFHSRAA